MARCLDQGGCFQFFPVSYWLSCANAALLCKERKARKNDCDQEEAGTQLANTTYQHAEPGDMTKPYFCQSAV